MKQIIFIIILFILNILTDSSSQTIEFMGLADKQITSLKIGTGLIAVGTNFNGVYWRSVSSLNDSNWNKIDFDSVLVTAVYPHKSGPIGWAIGIAARPSWESSDYIFCSYLGGKPKSLSYGIDTNNTLVILGLDGFPDPTVCGETFAIGGRKLYRRYFQDTVWHSVYNLTIEGNFQSLKARENFAEVYAGGAEGFAGTLLIRTSDKGNTWEYLSSSCPATEVDFWNGSDTTIFITDRYKLMRSSDNSKTWSNVFQIDSLRIQKISFSSNGKLFYFVTNNISSTSHVYMFYSEDKGNNWTSFQLPINDNIVGMDVDSEENIYLGTTNSGVFRLKQPIVKVEEDHRNHLTHDFVLANNFPNPFNNSTVIKYSIPKEGFVTLNVYNILGEKVSTLINEFKLSGNYELRFNTEQLASGIYFYKLIMGEFAQTRKMILTK